jgi:hypothetical protein
VPLATCDAQPPISGRERLDDLKYQWLFSCIKAYMHNN